MLYIENNKEVNDMNSKKIENLLQQELIEAVGYLRLSRDDGEEESTSITNQRAIIEDWAKQHGFVITKWYIDDGYSGYSMNRPDFNELKQDLNDGHVDVIIAKHLSRIGRKGWEVNLFLENIQEEGKRVIKLGDWYYLVSPNAGANVDAKDILLTESADGSTYTYSIVRFKVINADNYDAVAADGVKSNKDKVVELLANGSTLANGAVSHYLEKYKSTIKVNDDAVYEYLKKIYPDVFTD